MTCAPKPQPEPTARGRQLLGSGRPLPSPPNCWPDAPLGGLGWVGSWLAPEAGSHGQRVLPSPAQLGPTPAVWSHSPQTADDPRTPPRRWWEGDAAVPVDARAGVLGGGGIQGRGTPLSFSSRPWGRGALGGGLWEVRGGGGLGGALGGLQVGQFGGYMPARLSFGQSQAPLTSPCPPFNHTSP